MLAWNLLAIEASAYNYWQGVVDRRQTDIDPESTSD